jgi:hypothetical protein
MEELMDWGDGERDEDQVSLSVAEAEGENVELEIFSNGAATISWELVDSELSLTEGTTIDLLAVLNEDYEEMYEEYSQFDMQIDEIFYDSLNYNESYITVTFIMATKSGETFESYNAYCDIDGSVKQQKIKDYQGNWASCQNSYECESNLCSSGECVGLAGILEEANSIKKFFVRVGCKLANLFDLEEYNECLYNYLGNDFEEGNSGDSDGGSGGGGGSPPEMPE